MSIRDDLKRQGYRPVAEIARAVGVVEDTVRNWARRGKVTVRRVGGGGRDSPSVYISVESVISHLGEEWRPSLEDTTAFTHPGADVWDFPSPKEAAAFVAGARRFAPAGTVFRVRGPERDGGLVHVEILES